MLHIKFSGGLVLLTYFVVAEKHNFNTDPNGKVIIHNPRLKNVNVNDKENIEMPESVGQFHRNISSNVETVSTHPLEPLQASASEHKNYKQKSGKGSEHYSEYKDKQGYRDVKGYEERDKHNVSDGEKHGKKQHSDYKEAKGKKTSGYADEADHYSKHDKGGKKHKSSKFAAKKGHKKGHKTKGYYNKFIRDEFIKEHKFYDDAHKSGHHSKEGEHKKYYENKSGGREKGSKSESDNHGKHHGEKGHHDKGSQVDEHDKYKSKEGHESRFKNSKRYGKENDSHGGKYYGFHF